MDSDEEIQKYLDEKKEIQRFVLSIISNDVLIDGSVINKCTKSHNELKLFLCLLLRISNNHHNAASISIQINKILSFLRQKITSKFSNFEIFDIFKTSKRILLFLFEEKIIIPDEHIVKIMTSYKYSKKGYPYYFINEIKSFIDQDFASIIEKENKKIDTTSLSFDEKRKIGENDSYLCQLIRNDSINDFISHVNLKNIPLRTTIEISIFESNSFLLNKKPSLIEYAAFHGSIQIFKYLHLNKMKENSSIWLYAIHGQNPEIIHLLEENKTIKMTEKFCKNCVIESIKCHHNDLADYFINNFFENSITDDIDVFSQSIRYCNYEYFPSNLTNEFYFDNLCKYDYFSIVKFLLSTQKVDINANSIQKNFVFFIKFKQKIIFYS